MKKVFLKIVSLLSIILIVGCATEDMLRSSTSSMEVRHISFEEFEKNRTAREHLQNYRRKGNQSSMQRIIYDSIRDFYIDTDEIIAVEKDGYSSFTFAVYRDIPKEYVENLLFVKQTDGKYSSFLVRYDLSDAEKDAYLNGIPVTDLQEKMTALAINRLGCVPTIYSHCNYSVEVIQAPNTVSEGDLVGQEGPAQTVVYTLIGCNYTVVGCYDGWGSDVRNPFTGGGGHGSSEPPPEDSTGPPIEPGEEDLTDEDGNILILTPFVKPDMPCKDLATRDSNTEFHQKMTELHEKSGNQNFESGYILYQNPTSGLLFSDEQVGSTAKAEIKIDLTTTTENVSNSIGVLHCHLENVDTFKVFSYSDIVVLATVASLSVRPTSELTLYVVTQSGTFAMKINNRIILQNLLPNLIANENSNEISFAAFVNTSLDINAQAKGFLQFLRAMSGGTGGNGWGIDLYQKDYANNKWDKLKLSSNGESVIETPCN